MWGNSLGWIISAVIAIAVGVLLGVIAFGGGASISTPTSFVLDESNLAIVELPISPASLLPAADPCDGGELYREAMRIIREDIFTYREFARAGTLKSGDAEKLAALEPVIRATRCSGMKLFIATPEDVLTYAHDKPALDTVTLLGQVCADRMGLLNQKAGNAAEAKKHYEAAFALGAKLYRERVCWPECDAGLSLMGRTAPALAKLAEGSGDAEGARRCREFDAARISYTEKRLNPMVRVVRSIDPHVVAEHAGDLFVIADKSPERMWRVEAVLALGRLRYFAGEKGRSVNQRAAMVKLKELSSDPDPVVSAAAKTARELTAEEFRMQ